MSTGQSGALIHGDVNQRAARSAEYIGEATEKETDQADAISYKFSGIPS
jgi:hypothetical protein